jgi:hypothetical protein
MTVGGSGTGSDRLPLSKICNHWPPQWTWVAGTGTRCLEGESAILKNVAVSEFQGVSSCHLLVEHETSNFIGTLPFDDVSFCRRVYEFLLDHCGESIQSIGELTIDDTDHPAHGPNDQLSGSMGHWV